MLSSPRRRRTWGLLLVLCALVMSWSGPARAHDMRPATLSLVEHEDGRIDMRWNPPVIKGGDEGEVRPVFPEHCEVAGPSRLDCGEDGLSGTLRIEGMEGKPVEVVVQITRADGSSQTSVLRARNPELDLGAGGGGGATVQLALAYIGIGIEHILLGIDHLLFVFGLLLVVGFERRLITTITSFTVAHSITLAFSVLDIFRAPSAPVEAVIALSILLVASEALDDRPTLARRAPWAVAFSFGLLHGFGFAGALMEIGLPSGQVPLALLCFNVGVELGQLAVVGVVYVGWRLLRSHEELVEKARWPVVYAMGTVAAFWTIERILAIFE